MKLSTPVPITNLPLLIDYNSKMLLLGSCFTEHIGSKLNFYGFEVAVNPFGIVFNSTSLRILVQRAIKNQIFTLEDCTNHYSYFCHSDLNSKHPEQLVLNLNNALHELRASLKTATHLFLTLGTAWVYRHIEKDSIVANCHKQPQHVFKKELLSIEAMTLDLKIISELTQQINPDVSITYTLSPVRHVKDGFIENQRSKSRLHEAIQNQIDVTNASYFPAYEIAMDELRDYRFYARDMLHLNELGIDFIWSRFRESGINNNTLPKQKAIEKYRNLSNHKASDVATHQQLINKVKEELASLYPDLHL
jgi:hypothetical protein